MEVVNYNGGVLLVRKMPADGHCLFSSLVCQYYRTLPEGVRHLERVWELRGLIVEHIRENLEIYWDSLTDTVSNLRIPGTDVTQQIENFLYRLRDSPEWGGEESIASAAKILRQRIEVYHENGPVLVYNEVGGVHGLIRVAYRSAGMEVRGQVRNHYDSVMQKLRTTSGLIGSHRAAEMPSNSDERLILPVTQISAVQRAMEVQSSQIPAESNETQLSECIPIRTATFKFLSWNVRGKLRWKVQ